MHLAAESHVDRSIDGPGEFIATNVTGSVRMSLFDGRREEFIPLIPTPRACS